MEQNTSPAAQLVLKRRRNHMIATVALITTALVTILILARGLRVDVSKVPSALLGKEAKAFNVDWLEGSGGKPTDAQTMLTLEAFKGRPIILNFWASWCVSCRAEAGYFEEFWRKHQNDGLVMIGIAVQDTDEDAKAFASTFKKTYYLGIDRDGRAGIDYGVYGVPETFFIDRQGIIRHKEAGPVTTQMLAEHLPKIL
jgi:cytochrome c biogenesis protein CcmG/thiol:disulfide interchange protein DsbE